MKPRGSSSAASRTPSSRSGSRTISPARCPARPKSRRPASATGSSRACRLNGFNRFQSSPPATGSRAPMTLTLNAAALPSDFGTLETPLLVIALASTPASASSSAPTLTSDLQPIDAVTSGALGRVLSRRDFRGGRDETLHLAGGERGVERILLVGMGPAADRASALRRAGAIAARQANRMGVGRLAFVAGSMTADEVEAAGLGLIAGAWDFKEMKTAPPAEEQRAPLDQATILNANADANNAGVRAAQAIGEGHSLARRLGMLPGNICTPDYLAETARD